ncbi:MAG: hypothetical protein AAFO95_16735 [Cyanobacteria bacterium J06600_6]
MNTKKAEQGQLLKAAFELAKALDKVADDNLPEKLAGIVKLHAGIAVGSAFIPIPGADIAAAAGNIWTMYVRINKELELPFAENIIKSLASGVLTNLGSAALGYMVIGSAFKLIPGLGSLGGAAVMSATIYGVTIASGIIYMKAVSNLLNAKASNQVNEENLKIAVNEIMKDKESIQTIFKTAKEGYQEEDEIEQITVSKVTVNVEEIRNIDSDIVTQVSDEPNVSDSNDSSSEMYSYQIFEEKFNRKPTLVDEDTNELEKMFEDKFNGD